MNHKQGIIITLISTFTVISVYCVKDEYFGSINPFFNFSNPGSRMQWKSQPFYPFYTELHNATKIASRIAFADRINMSRRNLLEYSNYLQTNAKKTEQFNKSWQAYFFDGLFTGEILPWTNLKKVASTLDKGLDRLDQEIKTREIVKQQKNAARRRLEFHHRYLLKPITWVISRLPAKQKTSAQRTVNSIYEKTLGRNVTKTLYQIEKDRSERKKIYYYYRVLLGQI